MEKTIVKDITLRPERTAWILRMLYYTLPTWGPSRFPAADYTQDEHYNY